MIFEHRENHSNRKATLTLYLQSQVGSDPLHCPVSVQILIWESDGVRTYPSRHVYNVSSVNLVPRDWSTTPLTGGESGPQSTPAAKFRGNRVKTKLSTGDFQTTIIPYIVHYNVNGLGFVGRKNFHIVLSHFHTLVVVGVAYVRSHVGSVSDHSPVTVQNRTSPDSPVSL